MSDEITPSQAAWNRFADQLKEVGQKIVGPIGARSPRERADGFRYLASLIASGHELEMEANRAHPVLARAFTPIRSFVGDGPDTLYHDAKLDESLSYEFTIRRGDDIFFSIVVYASDDDGMRSMTSFLIDKDIVFEEDGGDQVAAIHISAERPEGVKNWLKLEAKEPFIMTRQYFPECVIEVDKGKYRAAIMNIECVDDVPPPTQYALNDLSAGLGRLIAFMHDTVDAGLGVSAIVGMSNIEYDSYRGGWSARGRGRRARGVHVGRGVRHDRPEGGGQQFARPGHRLLRRFVQDRRRRGDPHRRHGRTVQVLVVPGLRQLSSGGRLPALPGGDQQSSGGV
jgi:hypothetical protein